MGIPLPSRNLKQVSLLFHLLNFTPTMPSASLTGFIKEQNGGHGWSHARRACAIKPCAHICTHASMYVLRWREESREDRARHPVPSPISVMCSTSPSLKRSPLPPPSWRSGCVQAGGVPYHIHCIGSRGLEVFMRRKASQQFYSHVRGP